MSADPVTSTEVATRPPRPLSDDTIFIGNLPEHFTRADLRTWCDSNFTTLPDHILVRKPRVRNGEPPAVRFGFLRFDDKNIAAATLQMFSEEDEEPFTIDGVEVEAQWAMARRERAAGGKKKQKRAKESTDAEAGEEGGDAGAGGGSKKRRRKKKKKSKAPAEPEPEPEPELDRVYAKNFGSEDELRAALEAHGEVQVLEVKEVRRGPGAGQAFAFATFATEDQAAAAVAAHAAPEGDEATTDLIVAHARPRRARRARAPAGEGGEGKSKSKSKSIRLEEPSKVDLCCRNLPFSMDDAGLLALFKDFAGAESARIITRGSRSRGYGFVHFSDEGQAAEAQEALNGSLTFETATGGELSLSVDFALSAPRPIEDPEAAAAAAAGN